MKLFTRAGSLLCSVLTIVLLFSSSFESFRHVSNEKYIIDRKESVVTWKCAMQYVANYVHFGFVDISEGELTFNNDQLLSGTIAVDMNTIVDEHHEATNDLVGHLKSSDFFNVTKFPTSTFTITRVASVDGDSLRVTGNLTIKDITHEVTFPVKMEVKAGAVNANGKVIIDRTKWDVRYGSGKFFGNLADETISDDIELDVKIVARRE